MQPFFNDLMALEASWEHQLSWVCKQSNILVPVKGEKK